MNSSRPLRKSSRRQDSHFPAMAVARTIGAFLVYCMLLGSASLAQLVFAQSTTLEIAVSINAKTDRALRTAFEAKDSSYTPRTEHLLENGQPKYINRLIREDSPYLLQHAHNPVNWYPWGEEAFNAAKSLKKPIFLSIGYATCHWCHVMERESFENEAIAALMNANFISIKVDREQLPDVDALYMNAVMMINGNGGWPMSSFLDIDGRTFHAGTYFPPDQFSTLLERISTLWTQNNLQLLARAKQLTDALKEANELATTTAIIGTKQLDLAAAAALSRFDDFQGGFGSAPKFPQESVLHFLLDHAERSGNADALHAAHFSLQRMAAGGIHDQIGGGFHRYAVDDDWLVPHFEKMLYNQGSLARNYLQAYRLTGDKDHARTARRILDYVLRDMRSADGLFYSATDADSDGGEGRFFTWTPAELVEVLGTKDARLAQILWGVSESGHLDARSILHRPSTINELANLLDTSAATLYTKRDQWSDALFAHRRQRIPPLRDEKIITAWNSLMITALAEASDSFAGIRYRDAAIQAAEALWDSTRPAPGTLWRTQFDGKPSIEARQSDYAYFADALLSLYDITGDNVWLDRAEELTAEMLRTFWDTQNGGFFMARADTSAAALIVRPKDLYDTSMATGNGVAMQIMSRLFKRTGKPVYNEYADKLIAAFAGALEQQSGGHYSLLTGISDYLRREAGPRQFGARGVLKATAIKADDGSLAVHIDIAPGWHINSNRPYQDYLIPTTLSANDDTINAISYPEPVDRQLDFERSVLSLYEGSVVLEAQVSKPGVHQLQARLQACSDTLCLAPETLTLTLQSY